MARNDVSKATGNGITDYPARPHSSRRFGFCYRQAILALTFLALATGTGQAMAQMVSTGAKDRTGLPLPAGIKPPAADFRDLASEAGLKAVVVSGEFKQKYLVEGTGTG